MKINLDAPEIESNFEGQSEQFQIDSNSAIIMETLRSRMYTNPSLAMCREIMDNARDAHREVGKQNVPITVIMPGDYMTIIDEGPGMTPDRINSVYRIYGRSTKRGTNDQGGGFGIGAKTPFAYTDSFMIVTRVDGTEWIYNAYIDESKCGAIKLMQEQPTTQKNGTEIRVPIQRYDRDTIKGYLASIPLFWHLSGDAWPDFIGQEIDPLVPIHVEPNMWATYNDDRVNKYDVVVNGMGYKHDNITFAGTVTIFNTGEISLSATREKIQVTKADEVILETKINHYKQIIKDTLLKNIKTFADFLFVHKELYRKKLLDTNVFTLNGQQFVFNNNYITYYKYHWYNTIYSQTDSLYDIKNCIIVDDYDLSKYNKSKINKIVREQGETVILTQDDYDSIPYGDYFTNLYKIEDIKLRGNSKRTVTKIAGFVPTKYKVNISIDGSTYTDQVPMHSKQVTYYSIYKEDFTGIYPVQYVTLIKTNVKKLTGNWRHISEYEKDRYNELKPHTTLIAANLGFDINGSILENLQPYEIRSTKFAKALDKKRKLNAKVSKLDLYNRDYTILERNSQEYKKTKEKFNKLSKKIVNIFLDKYPVFQNEHYITHNPLTKKLINYYLKMELNNVR